MEKKKMDFTPFLQSGEKVLFKQRSQKNNIVFVELAICFLLFLGSISADWFFLGAMFEFKTVTKLSNDYLLVLIPSIFIHIVPFAFWMFSIFKRLSPIADKWYAITDRRIAVVSGIKPINVTYLDFADITAVSLNNNKVIVKFGEEKLTLGNLEDADLLYDVLEKTLFPDEESAEDNSVDGDAVNEYLDVDDVPTEEVAEENGEETADEAATEETVVKETVEENGEKATDEVDDEDIADEDKTVGEEYIV